MTSEVDNILKGVCVSTMDYDSSKKIIGIGTNTIVSTQESEAPLSKQSAFIAKSEIVDNSLAQNAEKVLGFNPSLGVSINETNAQTVENPIPFTIPEPKVENGLTEISPVFVNPVGTEEIVQNNVETANPQAIVTPEIIDETIVTQTQQPLETVPPDINQVQNVAPSTEMPVISLDNPTTVEPTSINDELFVNENVLPTLPTSVEIKPDTFVPVSLSESAEELENELLAKINELIKDYLLRIKEKNNISKLSEDKVAVIDGVQDTIVKPIAPSDNGILQESSEVLSEEITEQPTMMSM